MTSAGTLKRKSTSPSLHECIRKRKQPRLDPIRYPQTPEEWTVAATAVIKTGIRNIDDAIPAAVSTFTTSDIRAIANDRTLVADSWRCILKFLLTTTRYSLLHDWVQWGNDQWEYVFSLHNTEKVTQFWVPADSLTCVSTSFKKYIKQPHVDWENAFGIYNDNVVIDVGIEMGIDIFQYMQSHSQEITKRWLQHCMLTKPLLVFTVNQLSSCHTLFYDRDSLHEDFKECRFLQEQLDFSLSRISDQPLQPHSAEEIRGRVKLLMFKLVNKDVGFTAPYANDHGGEKTSSFLQNMQWAVKLNIPNQLALTVVLNLKSTYKKIHANFAEECKRFIEPGIKESEEVYSDLLSISAELEHCKSYITLNLLGITPCQGRVNRRVLNANIDIDDLSDLAFAFGECFQRFVLSNFELFKNSLQWHKSVSSIRRIFPTSDIAEMLMHMIHARSMNEIENVIVDILAEDCHIPSLVRLYKYFWDTSYDEMNHMRRKFKVLMTGLNLSQWAQQTIDIFLQEIYKSKITPWKKRELTLQTLREATASTKRDGECKSSSSQYIHVIFDTNDISDLIVDYLCSTVRPRHLNELRATLLEAYPTTALPTLQQMQLEE